MNKALLSEHLLRVAANLDRQAAEVEHALQVTEQLRQLILITASNVALGIQHVTQLSNVVRGLPADYWFDLPEDFNLNRD